MAKKWLLYPKLLPVLSYVLVVDIKIKTLKILIFVSGTALLVVRITIETLTQAKILKAKP
ncbi:hypothetical protein J2S07_001553 [Robertmurraya andreesenii]|uniref:Uncharacterized protein n=1 Tax=Anoxybacillus andreesenii TaxID=1325932 RepID=A0ABT9V2R9_9BACL|nr:hypothetical protein [Robertmurraya andreesenii]